MEFLVDIPALLIIALVCAVVSVLLDRLHRWWSHYSVRRLSEKIQREVAEGTYVKPKLIPESLHTVCVTDQRVVCTDPDNAETGVEWTDLQKVEIVTNDLGPFLPDVFWMLRGTNQTCVVPLGATGEEELVQRLQQLQGFNFEAYCEAMSSTSNQQFLCWQKGDFVAKEKVDGQPS